MVNEVILTALRNAIISGESLDTAVQIMINSGYNAREVHEASIYVSKGVISNLQPQQPQASQQYTEQQTRVKQIALQQPLQQPLQGYQQPLTVNQQPVFQQQIQQQTSTQQPAQKKSYKKEIILVVLLIILLIILGGTIFFKDKILGFLTL